MASAILTACKASRQDPGLFLPKKFNEEELYVGGEEAEHRTKAQNRYLSVCKSEYDASNSGSATQFGAIYSYCVDWMTFCCTAVSH